MLMLLSGGVRSGKSALGEKIVLEKRTNRAVYIATALVTDKEMEHRVLLHQKNREGKGFITMEESGCLGSLIPYLQTDDCVLIDCLGTYLSNRMFGQKDIQEDLADSIVKEIIELSAAVQWTVLISNDLFRDSPIYTDLTECYRMTLGKIQSQVAERADLVVECVCGHPILWKGELQ